jgi:hypothetical protein
MLDIRNKTPFPASLAPLLDKHGRESALIAVKGTFTIRNHADRLAPAEAQEPLAMGDVFHGEPDASSLKYESDMHAPKPGTDVSLLGHAYTREPGKAFVDAGLKVGGLSKIVRVFGDRVWFKALGFWVPSEPIPFEKIPVLYERAFGGKDFSHPDEKKHAVERRNPVGTGFMTQGKDDFLEDLPLPNLEDPNDLIAGTGDKPAPAGFGLVAGNWLPRREFSGTYDDAWRQTRFPFLPADFDERFHHAASPGLASAAKLAGGEPVRYVNLSEDHDVSFALPKRAFRITASVKGVPGTYAALLDSVVIEPDAGRIMLTWKAVIPCNRNFLYVDAIKVEEAK